MTTVPQFTANVNAALEYLDTVLPAGSHVLLMGLPDGRILYDTMHNLMHPVGVPYKQLYDYLNCLGISPCYVWMNSNSTIRDAGSARAAELSAALEKIARAGGHANFDIDYTPCPVEEAIKRYKGPTSDLIEPVDGFHPSQTSMALIAEVVWEFLEKSHPSWIGPENAN